MADEEAVRAARLALTDATRSVVRTGLFLLGIPARSVCNRIGKHGFETEKGFVCWISN
jgi:hypothetical protein